MRHLQTMSEGKFTENVPTSLRSKKCVSRKQFATKLYQCCIASRATIDRSSHSSDKRCNETRLCWRAAPDSTSRTPQTRHKPPLLRKNHSNHKWRDRFPMHKNPEENLRHHVRAVVCKCYQKREQNIECHPQCTWEVVNWAEEEVETLLNLRLAPIAETPRAVAAAASAIANAIATRDLASSNQSSSKSPSFLMATFRIMDGWYFHVHPSASRAATLLMKSCLWQPAQLLDESAFGWISFFIYYPEIILHLKSSCNIHVYIFLGNFGYHSIQDCEEFGVKFWKNTFKI